MSTFTTQINEDIEKGKQYFSNLNTEFIRQLKAGKFEPCVDNLCQLKRILRALEYKKETDNFDSIANKLYQCLLKIIGGYQQQTPPSVEAGANQSSQLEETVVFTAIIVEGSSSISSIVWTQISGQAATLSGQNTEELTVTGYKTGTSVFKVEVTDTNGLKASDTVSLIGLAQQVTIRYGVFDSAPNSSSITFASSIQVAKGASSFNINFGNTVFGGDKWIAFDQPSTEPDKTKWVNDAAFNYGTMPDSAMKAKEVVSGKSIYISRNPFVFSSGNSIITFSI